ncbi:hypothetical protein STEG23_007820 [Scotinomys teguina]
MLGSEEEAEGPVDPSIAEEDQIFSWQLKRLLVAQSQAMSQEFKGSIHMWLTVVAFIDTAPTSDPENLLCLGFSLVKWSNSDSPSPSDRDSDVDFQITHLKTVSNGPQRNVHTLSLSPTFIWTLEWVGQEVAFLCCQKFAWQRSSLLSMS